MIHIGVAGVGEGTHGLAWSTQLAGPDGDRVGMRVANIWDEKAAVAAEVAHKVSARAVSRLEEVAEGVDGVLITEASPTRYLQLGKPFLTKGIPVFFNRPFAGSVEDAEEIIRLSKKHHAPIMSASALYFSPTVEQARATITELAPVLLFCAVGPTGHIIAYLPHVIACIIGTLGIGVESVEALNFERNPENPIYAKGPLLAHLNYRGDAACGPASGVAGMVGPNCGYYKFRLKIFGAKREVPEIDCYPEGVGYLPLLRRMADFFSTRREPIPHEVILEKTRVFYAIQHSAEEKRRVYLKEYGKE